MTEEPPCPYGWSLVRQEFFEDDPAQTTEYRLWNDPTGTLTVSRLDELSAGKFRVCFFDQMVIDVRTEDQLIVDHSLPLTIPSSTRRHVLADQLYPRVLSHEGNLVLHAGAFEANDQSILVVGASGRGKSSLVASFQQAGYPLLGDDALVISEIDGVACAKAVYPSLRLFPDSIKALFAEIVSTTKVAPYTSKQRVEIPPSKASRVQPIPIQAIFILARRSTDTEIQLRRISVAESCMALVENSFALDPTDTQRAAKRLISASAIARVIPTFEISYPRSFQRLPQVREAILAQCAELIGLPDIVGS